MSEVDAVGAEQGIDRAAVAAMTFVLYDILLNLGDEVDMIWISLFMLIEHGIAWTPKRCMVMQVYQNIAIQSLTLAVELILLGRVYAMYSRNRILLYFLSTFLFVEVCCMVGVLSVTIPEFRMTEGCIVTHTPRLFSFYWILPLAFETTLFALTLFKFATSVTDRSVLGRRHSIMFVLLRDGTWAYAIIFAAMLLNTVFYAVETTPLAGVSFAWEIATLSFAGSHVILNTRRIAWQPQRVTSFWSNTGPEVSTIEFKTEGTARALVQVDVERHCEGPTVIELETMHRELPA
ncbi:hypothetical protein C8T65DRAFT_739556 [Cerioporus squamosus]|nr:hypothetical protein C8T65DRAFT_739556 [Cerioporus squamosus]